MIVSTRFACACAVSLLLAAPFAAKAGCLSGAAVGGVAGHVAGHHAMAGAAVGCAIGHHNAVKKQQQAQQAQTPDNHQAATQAPH
jgi:hypothetical protein